MATATYTVTQLWIIAIVSGIALAVAAQSMFVARKHKLIAILLPLIGAAGILLNSAARGYEGQTPLKLYTLTMVGLAVPRLIFARFVRRQLDLVRSGGSMEELTGKQTTIFLVTFVAVVMAAGVALSQLPQLWS